MRHFVFCLIALALLCAPALAADSLEKLEAELQALESELPAILRDETDLVTQHDYVKRVLALRKRIEALEGAEEEQVAANDPRVLILKSVELKYRAKGSGNYQKDETYNTDGFASEGRDDTLVRALKVEAYPGKIVIGEPFAFSAIAVKRTGASKVGVRLDRLYAAAFLGHAQINIRATGRRSASAGDTPQPLTTNINFSFTRNLSNFGAQYGEYDLDVSAEGALENTNDAGHYPNAKKLVLTKMMLLNIVPSHKNRALTFRFWVPAKFNTREEEKYLEFVYHYGESDGEPASVASFQLPDMSKKPETDKEEISPDQADEDQIAVAARQDANEKDVRRPHIEYWLANAVPVENVDPNYDLKFDQ